MKINSLNIEVDVYCQWIDECERLEASKRLAATGNGLGLIKSEEMTGSKKKNDKKENLSELSEDVEDNSEHEVEKEEEKVSEKSETEEEVARPVKRGPKFGGAARKPQPPKHKYLEPTGKMTDK